MKSNLALSLSFDGITLLHRVQDGWDLIGQTGLDVPDLAAALGQMRADALLLEPDGLRTKLIIPSEQIKFLTLETAQTELGDVLAALDGATPYAVDELVVDFDRNGGRTFIAAVARETLDEASGFATEHDFNPVCFAATPEDFTFQTEVFFGPFDSAAQPQVDRDADPTVQTGVAILPSTGEPDDPEAPAPMFTSRAKPASVVAAPTIEAASAKPTDAPEPISVTLPDAVPQAHIAAPKIAAIEAKPSKAPSVAAPVRADDLAESGGFSSRRKAPLAADPVVADVAAPEKTPSRASKKAAAIATKQASPVRQRPRFLGLILTAILLLFMAIVAIWASTLTEEELAGWFGFGTSSDIIVTEDPPATQVVAVAPQATAPDAADATDTPLDTPSEASPPAQVRLTANGRVLSPAEANRIYAATGVWQRAPRFPNQPRETTLQAALPAAFAAPADPAPMDLPDVALMQPDLVLLPPPNPPAAGTDFDRDADGFVRATPQGALTPSGAVVFAGRPSKVPPIRARAQQQTDAPDGVVLISGRPSKVPPRRPVFEAIEDPDAAPNAAPTDADEGALLAISTPQPNTPRPRLRPNTLVPAVIALANPALADNRPRLRPAGLAPQVEAPATPDIADVVGAIAAAVPDSPFVAVTSRAVPRSSRPDKRPRNIARLVARAQEVEAQRAAAAAASRAAAQTQTASAAPARASGPVPTTVARAATLDNAIRLRDINLIGVYGRPNDRRALVRMGNGRYVKVQVGSSLDGGRVSAIGDGVLNYVKRGRTVVLKLPEG